MEFTATELYIWLPLAFVYGCSLYAIRKALKPVDTPYQQCQRWNNATRRRRLSSLNEMPSRTTGLNQRTSHFLGRLPLEIRQEIYQMYYKDSRFVLDREGVLPSKHVAWMHRKDWRYLREDPGIGRIYVQRGVLSLPLTCRQMYSESIGYVYSTPDFECFGTKNAFELPRILLPQRWQAMTSFHFWFQTAEFMGVTNSGRPRVYQMAEWQRFWRAVAELPRLRRLSASIGSTYNHLTQDGGVIYSNQDICDQVLEPLLDITNIPTFEIWLSRRLRSMERYTSAPFRLSWHEQSTTQGGMTLMHLGENGEFIPCKRTAECCALRF